MKDTCTISLKAPATALLEDRGDIVMATAKYGKGIVFAVTDPWLYNEYTDGRKRPPQQDNYMAGKELVRWLLEQRRGEAGSRSGK
jgi:unsaturated rhamnogalacturonyl hydrolase